MLHLSVATVALSLHPVQDSSAEKRTMTMCQCTRTSKNIELTGLLVAISCSYRRRKGGGAGRGLKLPHFLRRGPGPFTFVLGPTL